MATFEQALDKAFEITFKHGQEVDEAKADTFGMEDEHMRDLLLASAEQTFIGSLDILGSLLHLAGRIPVFADSSSDRPGDWADGSRDTLLLMMEWAHKNEKIDKAEFTSWVAAYTENNPPREMDKA